MARIITMAQQKGGAGKTTLAAHLAAHWAAQCRVAVVDIDPQASLSGWHRVRQARGGLPPIHLAQISGWRTAMEVERLSRNFDIVLVDSPPHAATEARIAVRAADLVVVPVQLSPMDLWATGATIELAIAERRRIVLVLNRVAPRSNLATVIRAQIAEKAIPLTETTLGNRQGFAAALLDGMGVTESEPDSVAAEEVKALAAELLQRLPAEPALSS